MVVPVKAVLRCGVGWVLLGAVVLALSGCWNWIPQSPAPGTPAPADAGPSSAVPSGSSGGQAGGTAQYEPANAADWYTVEAGDTLFSIAWRFRMQLSDLAAWNQLGDGSLIFVGQRIRLRPPPGFPAASPAAAAGSRAGAAAPAPGGGGTASAPSASSASSAGAVRWQWPAQGRVDARGARSRPGDYGVRILGQRGQEVAAAAGGKVMYAGDGLRAYGLLVIVRHTPQWLSAYGHNERILVREGDEVRAGQPIAAMGIGPGNAAMLHFEIRRGGKPVEPMNLLPKRN